MKQKTKELEQALESLYEYAMDFFEGTKEEEKITKSYLKLQRHILLEDLNYVDFKYEIVDKGSYYSVEIQVPEKGLHIVALGKEYYEKTEDKSKLINEHFKEIYMDPKKYKKRRKERCC
jgi:hypothetical protein